MEKAIFAGGCFWCTEAVFQRLKGVEKVLPGYTGGNIKNPSYREICTGRTGHAEAIAITFNKDEVSFQTLLEIFFATHDATTLNRQGNDVGTQYRSSIFYTSEEQKEQSEAFIKVLNDKNYFKIPIVTKVEIFTVFYDAKEDHHNYYNENSDNQYCNFTITPKIEKIKIFFLDKLKSNM